MAKGVGDMDVDAQPKGCAKRVYIQHAHEFFGKCRDVEQGL